MTDDTAEREGLVKRLRDKAGTLFFNGMKSSAALMEEAATALESLGAPKPMPTEEEIDAECARIMAMSDEEVEAEIKAQGDDPAAVALRMDTLVKQCVEIVRLRGEIKRLAVPKLTPDQAEYLERIAAGQKYDPETIVGGPARPQTVTEAIDACAQLRDQSDLDLPPSWEPLFVEGYRHGCDECVSHIQNLAAVPPRASDTRSDLADLNYLRKPFPAPPPTSQSLEAKCLGDLLAIIHGDGGHYQAEHGIEKATQDAIEKWYAKPPTSQWRTMELDAIFSAYLGLGVLRTMCKHAGLKMGQQRAEEIQRELGEVFPEFAARSALRAAPPTEQDKP